MLEIGAFEAKNTLGGLLDRVELGEEIVITRRGKPVAKLTPIREGKSLEKAQAAARRIRALAQELAVAGPVTQAEIREWRDEGRR